MTNVNWVIGDIEHPPSQSESFDLVVSTNVLHHTDLSLALQQLARLVKPGGRIAIQDIYAASRLPRVFPLSYVFWTLLAAHRYLRTVGPVMMLRIVAFRLSRAEFQHTADLQRMTVSVLEEVYGQVLLGSRITPNRSRYLAHWDKAPGDKSPD